MIWIYDCFVLKWEVCELPFIQNRVSVAYPCNSVAGHFCCWPTSSEVSTNSPIYPHLGHKNNRQVIIFLLFLLNPSWTMDKIKVHFSRAVLPQQ